MYITQFIACVSHFTAMIHRPIFDSNTFVIPLSMCLSDAEDNYSGDDGTP
jgi:hypothetical protein